MASVIWSERALNDIDSIIAYIRGANVTAAGEVGSRLLELGNSLIVFAERGRPASSGARELTSVPPYILRYRVAEDRVTILSVRHGRRRPLK